MFRPSCLKNKIPFLKRTIQEQLKDWPPSCLEMVTVTFYFTFLFCEWFWFPDENLFCYCSSRFDVKVIKIPFDIVLTHCWMATGKPRVLKLMKILFAYSKPIKLGFVTAPKLIPCTVQLYWQIERKEKAQYPILITRSALSLYATTTAQMNQKHW